MVITDKMASYPPALRRVLPNSEHRRHNGLNNRAENSHLPTRQLERRMQRFTATVCRRLMEEQRQTWREVSAVPAAR